LAKCQVEFCNKACVKLMGSIDIADGQPGHMILDRGDLEVAYEERSRIFDILATHAARLTFLFIGYSFNDEIFLEIIDKLSNRIGTPQKKYYAVFKERPDEKKMYLLNQYGIIPIIADIDDFCKSLNDVVSIHDFRDLTRKKIPLGNDVIAVNPSKASSFFSQFYPILLEDYDMPIEPISFFKGNTESLQPFILKWHYPRKEIDAVINEVIKTTSRNEPSIISVIGPPGSGRTFTILASIASLIKDHRALAIKIQGFSFNPIPSKDELNRYIEEIEQAASNANVEKPKRIVFWAEFCPDAIVIAKFLKLASEIKYPSCLIFEEYGSDESKPESGLKPSKFKSISIDVQINKLEFGKLADYLKKVVVDLKLPEISKPEIIEIINKEEKFLPIVYRTLDPSRRSINKIIEEELGKINDIKLKKCIFILTAPSSQGLEMPIVILRRALSKALGKEIEFDELFEIILEKGKVFIKYRSDYRTNDLVTLYHPLIACHFIEILGLEALDDIVELIADSSDIKSRIEAEFIGDLFISKGVNRDSLMPAYCTSEGLEKAMLVVKRNQPARPILHHIARLYARNNIKDTRIIPLLEAALAEPREQYALIERKENVLTTLAKIHWEQEKETLIYLSRNDLKIAQIINLLVEARAVTPNNVHPYDYHVRILKEMASVREQEDKFPLINEALDVIELGLDYCQEDLDGTVRLNELMIECLAEIDYQKALESAEKLKDEKNEGAGYYSLAILEYKKNHNDVKASLMLDKALSSTFFPPGCLALKIELLLKDKFPNYTYLLELATKLSSIPNWNDTWKSAYYRAVIFAINGNYEAAIKLFKVASSQAPFLQRTVELFWYEEGVRKIHTGKIASINAKEGWIFAHSFYSWKDNIIFVPARQTSASDLKKGLYVDFEIGFRPRGPIAFEIRPHLSY